MTPEDKAVKQFMARDGYKTVSGACGCMGPQIRKFNPNPFSVQFEKTGNYMEAVAKIRVALGLSVADISTLLKSPVIRIEFPKIQRFVGDDNFSSKYDFMKVCDILNQLGLDFICDESVDERQPACPCAMNWYEEVDGVYYKINEVIGERGITFVAEKVTQ